MNSSNNHTPPSTPRQRSIHHGDARFEHHKQPPQRDSVFGRSSSQRQHQQGFAAKLKVSLMLMPLGISIIAFSAVTLYLNIKVHNDSLRNTVDTHQLRNFYRPHKNKKEDHLKAANAALLVASRQSSPSTKVDDDGDDDAIFENEDNVMKSNLRLDMKKNRYNTMKAELNQLRLEMQTKLTAEQSGLREKVRQQDRVIDALTRALEATLKNENENNSGNGDTSERRVVSGDSASEEDIQQQQRTRLSGSNTTDTVSMQHHSVEDEGSNQRGIESHLPLLSTHNNSNSLSNINSKDALPKTLTRKPSRYTSDGLEFIHIPKTAGGSIEKAAAGAGIKYGACHWVNQPWQGCKKGDRSWGLRLNKTRIPYKWRWEKPIGALWHVPWHWFKDDHNPYQNKTLFAVVRNPYERVVSEFFYRCESANQILQDSGLCNDMSSETMNAFIQNQSWPCLHGEKCSLIKDIFQKPQGHLIPQYDYVYDAEGNQVIDHILRFEHLNEDFSALMTLYDLPIRLPGKKIHARDNTQPDGNAKMTVANLTKSTIDVINKVYDKDFAAFNYLKVSSPDDFSLD